MYETLLRPQEVSTVSLPTIDQAVHKLKDAEVQAERRRLKQIANAREKEKGKERSLKRKRNTDGPSEDAIVLDDGRNKVSGAGDDLVNDLPSTGANKKRKEVHESDDATMMEEGEIEGDPVQPEGGDSGNNGNQRSGTKPSSSSSASMHVAHPFVEVRGHTSYLTFALLLPYQQLVKSLASTQIQPQERPQPEPIAAGNINTQETATTAHEDFDRFVQGIPEEVLAQMMG